MFFFFVIVVGFGIMGESLVGGNVVIVFFVNMILIGVILVVLIIIFGLVFGVYFNFVVMLYFFV